MYYILSVAVLASCCRDWVAHKAQHICSQVLCRHDLPAQTLTAIMVLATQGPEWGQAPLGACAQQGRPPGHPAHRLGAGIFLSSHDLHRHQVSHLLPFL